MRSMTGYSKLNYEDENGWRKGNGRNPKKEIVLEWRKNG